MSSSMPSQSTGGTATIPELPSSISSLRGANTESSTPSLDGGGIKAHLSTSTSPDTSTLGSTRMTIGSDRPLLTTSGKSTPTSPSVSESFTSTTSSLPMGQVESLASIPQNRGHASATNTTMIALSTLLSVVSLLTVVQIWLIRRKRATTTAVGGDSEEVLRVDTSNITVYHNTPLSSAQPPRTTPPNSVERFVPTPEFRRSASELSLASVATLPRYIVPGTSGSSHSIEPRETPPPPYFTPTPEEPGSVQILGAAEAEPEGDSDERGGRFK
ncbi:hypothetical protein BXZ70DRAFT_1010548 [Cristinia sonorae]|uniref:Uncharacterized protein n=1 Tax=Cristinia sonorae TaxID=1940300 RepID=A0A8K0XM84_9AGAR|nr:hypothetical protein BXZ70DRAFT_1010548 [Cristinia sonorae]